LTTVAPPLVIVAAPALDVAENLVWPGCTPALLLIVAVPAVEVFEKLVEPPPPDPPKTVPALLLIVAAPAVEVFEKLVEPPDAPKTVLPLLLIVAVSAVLVFENSIALELDKVGLFEELLAIPVPLICKGELEVERSKK
jgi:hypothetical protein